MPTATPPGQDVPSDDITAHLVTVREGGQPALDALFAAVYDRLRVLARARQSPSIDATELVHEAYLKFVDSSRTNWNDRQHFFAVAGRAIRQIVVDHARREGAVKRGSGFRLTTLGDTAIDSVEPGAACACVPMANAAIAAKHVAATRVRSRVPRRGAGRT